MGSQDYRYNSFPGGFSSSKSQGKPKRAGILCMLPCTVSQLLSATERMDSFFVRGMEINQVTVVGLIRSAKLTLTHVVYSLDDMTGPPLDVKQWLNLEDVNLNGCVFPPGTYIKVVGSLRSFQHHRSIVSFSVRRLEDFNEITSHMLEVIQAHLLGNSSSYSKLKNETMNTSHAIDPATFGFTANQRQVFNLIKNCPVAEGISMQSLRNLLKYLTFCDIRTCLQFLINEGHIFSTIDDDHFKCTYG